MVHSSLQSGEAVDLWTSVCSARPALACRATPSSGRPFHSHLLRRCGPCKLIAPIFAALSEEISTSEAVFLKVDVDENEDTARKFEVMQMPVSTEMDEAQD